MIPATAATRRANRSTAKSVLHVFIVFAFVTSLSGCAGRRGMLIMGTRDPMAKAPRLSCGSDPQMEEVVAHLNRTTDRLQSWRASNVKIRTKGVPVTLSGQLAVEKMHRVRLVVSSPLGTEFDLGSNDQRFWVWSRQPEPAFVTCKHENIDAVRQSYGVPFEPSWLMEALGVSPLPTSGVQLEMLPTKEELRLVQQFYSAHGKPLRRVVLVNLKKGGIITEHSLYDYNGAPIAIAKLGAHHYDKGIVLPHRIELNWPGNDLSVTMDLGKVDINPTSIPSQVFEMQEHRGCEMIQLDADLPQRRLAVRPEGREGLEGLEALESYDEGPMHNAPAEFSGHDDDRDHVLPEAPVGRARLSFDDSAAESDAVSEQETEDWEWAQ
ncbi:hypothetical protein [Schlesneria paludicola]|uniref:hypothetical protein n=1 Tax=Schlesneria paludicola TaxID=360056 RepID=UPI000299F279|nr:hypothetical protein [Schlesneria paludicola]